ncbi:MAG: hypothetical protein ACFFBD_08170 [Candidatus Hodarchaeota archaeon]
MGAPNNDIAKILEVLKSLERKVDLLTEQFSQLLNSDTPLDIFDVIDRRKELHNGTPPTEVVKSLPPHLQKTYENLVDLGCADALTLSEEQWGDEKDKRAVASDHLNQLSVLGLVKKTRLARKVIFYISDEDNPRKILKTKSKICTAEEISLSINKDVDEVKKWLDRANDLGIIGRVQIAGTGRSLYSYPPRKNELTRIMSST